MLRARLTAQLLAGAPARDPVAVAERLLAIQGQDPRGARLAVRARTEGLTAADVDRALTDDRSLLITWLNRGTLHLVRSEDYPWLQALTTPPAPHPEQPPARAGGSAPGRRRARDRGDRTLARRGRPAQPSTSCASGWTPSGCEPRARRLSTCCSRPSLRGLIVRGPMVDGKHAYVLVSDWLGKPKPVDRDRALPEFARRYLAGHGPASDRDLARWAGLPLRDARAGLQAPSRQSCTRLGDGPRGPEAPTESRRAATAQAARRLRAAAARLDLARGRASAIIESFVTDQRALPPVRTGQRAVRWRAGACRAARWRWSRLGGWRRPIGPRSRRRRRMS